MAMNKKRKKLHGVKLPSSAVTRRNLMGDFFLEDIHDYRIDRYTFTIYVGGETTFIDADNPESLEPGVEHNMADRFELNLGTLSGIDPNRPILINMASCGGHWEEGMQMMGAILVCPNPVTILASKWARSMTSIITLGADRFVLRPPGQYMFHHGSYQFSGLAQEAETDMIELLKVREMMLRIYIARLRERGKFKKWSEDRIYAMLVESMEKKIDVWLDADEAKLWGFIDDVFDGDWDTLRASARNEKRRKKMFEVLRRPIKVDIKVR